MEASVLDFRTRMGDILRAIDRRERVTLTYRGRPKAEVVPVNDVGNSARRKTKVADLEAFGMWADREDTKDALRCVRKIREGRKF